MFAVWAPTEFRWRTVSIAAMLAWVSHVDSPKNLQPELTTSQGLFRLNLVLAFIVVILMLLFSFLGVCEGVCWHQKAVSSSIRLCFLPLRSGSLAEPKIRLVTSKPQQFSYLLYPWPLYWSCNHLQAIPDILCDFRRFELRSSCFYSKCCYPLSRLPSPSIPFRKTHSIILNYQCLLCH